MSPNPAQPVNAWGAANDQWKKQQQGQQPAAGGAPAPAPATPAANPYAPQAATQKAPAPAPTQQQPAQQYQPPSRGYYGEPQPGASSGGGISSPQPNQAKPIMDSKMVHGQDAPMPMDSGMGTQIGGIDGGGWGGGAQSFLAGGPGGPGSSYLDGDAPPMQIQQGNELAGSPMRRHGRRM